MLSKYLQKIYLKEYEYQIYKIDSFYVIHYIKIYIE